jgi:hypothetical protein
VTLSELLDRPASTGEDVAAHARGLAGARRLEECLSLSPARQKRLWDLARGVPPEDGLLASSGAEVFVGRNSLRLFSHFEKWFARQDGRIVGCNRHSLSRVIGPGYFTVTDDGPGRLAFDYGSVPAQAPQGWAPVAPNSGALARPVYGDLLDRVAWISPDVLIGAAFRAGKAMHSYFVLVRKAR